MARWQRRRLFFRLPADEGVAGGVGHGHAEPTISCYQVTRLNDLVLRVLRSELTGIRAEAPAKSVIRSVGSYTRGRCRT